VIISAAILRIDQLETTNIMRIIAASILLLLPMAHAAEKHPWASFKPGSYAKMKSTTTVAGNKTVSEVTQTLISVDANTAVVEIESKAMGQTSKTRVPMPLKGAANPANAPKGPTPVMTNETLTVAGKSLPCKCMDVNTDANGMKTNSHACTSDAVPGGAVKVVSKTTGAMKMESVMELVEFAAK
jgi:hypothetical protein